MMRPIPPLLLTAALSAALAACSRQEPETTPVDNAAIDVIETPTPSPSPSPLPTMRAPAPDENLSTDDTAAAEPAAPDEQMMDDASATGMTARAARDDGAADDAPVTADVEKK